MPNPNFIYPIEKLGNVICPCCRKQLVGIENPYVYDGVSSWYCVVCRVRFMRKGFEDLKEIAEVCVKEEE